MKILIQTLYTLSTVLLVPVIIGLLGLMAWVLTEVGGFLREILERRRNTPNWRAFLAEMQAHPNPPDRGILSRFFERNRYPGFLATFASAGKPLARNPLHLGRLVANLEIEASRRLSRMNFGIRIGPILGLMGTLIPLGPGLIGLASGNIEELARSLVVAFSTTVLGLFVGGVCYVMSLVRRSWYAQDLADIEYLYQSLLAAEGKKRDVVSESL